MTGPLATKKLKTNVIDFEAPDDEQFQFYQHLLIKTKLEKCLDRTIIDCKLLISERVAEINASRRQQFEIELVEKKKTLAKSASKLVPLMQDLQKICTLYQSLQPSFAVLCSKLAVADQALIARYEDWSACEGLFSECIKLVDKTNTDNLIYWIDNIKDIRVSIERVLQLFEECQRMIGSYRNRLLLLGDQSSNSLQ